MNQPTQSQFECHFLQASHKFSDTHEAGEDVTNDALSRLATEGGYVEVSGRWPNQIKSVRCSAVCSRRIIVPLESGQLAGNVALAGGCIALKRLQDEQAAQIQQELTSDT